MLSSASVAQTGRKSLATCFLQGGYDRRDIRVRQNGALVDARDLKGGRGGVSGSRHTAYLLEN
jgi:hypothetical protein